MPTSHPLAAALLLLSIVAVSGCTSGTDVSGIAKSLPAVQEFLRANPSADVRAALWPQTAVEQQIEAIRADCRAPIEPVALYRIDITDAGLDATLWLDANTRQVLCVIKRGAVGPGTKTPTQGICESRGGLWNACPGVQCEAGTPCPAVCGEARCEPVSKAASLVEGETATFQLATDARYTVSLRSVLPSSAVVVIDGRTMSIEKVERACVREGGYVRIGLDTVQYSEKSGVPSSAQISVFVNPETVCTASPPPAPQPQTVSFSTGETKSIAFVTDDAGAYVTLLEIRSTDAVLVEVNGKQGELALGNAACIVPLNAKLASADPKAGRADITLWPSADGCGANPRPDAR